MGMKPPATLDPRPPEQQAPGDRPRSYAQLDLDKKSTSKNRWWVWAIVFALIGFGCYELYQYEGSKKAALASRRGALRQRSIPIVATAALSGDMPVYLQGIGTVTAFNTVNVKTRVDGQLINVTYHEGQFVNKGDLLAEIDPRPYQVALEQARSSKAQAEGTLARDEAALKDAQANYARDQELFREQIIAKQQLDTQLATADQARGAIQADQAAIQAAEATISNAQLNLTYTKITAPISGRIGLRLVDAGNMVHASDATGLAIIAQLQPIAVLFSIPQDQLPSVLAKLHAGTTLHTQAFDRDQTKKLADGTLLTVDNQIDTTTGTSRLKAVFPNTDGALFPNQFVNVRLALDTKRGAIIVPAVAIQRGPTGTFVYMVGEDDTVSVKPVRVGLSQGDNVSIEEGLAPGDRVVIDGAEKLNEGMKVTVRKPGQAMDGGGPVKLGPGSAAKGRRRSQE
jgi:membrane fusion protein, multidrug efflux system